MTASIFADTPAIRYEGPDSHTPLAFRYYDADRVVLGRPMADHLRIAVAYWHSFCGDGADTFGPGTHRRPWHTADDMAHAKTKLHAAFDFFERLGNPFFCFHDVDVCPLGDNLTEAGDNLFAMRDLIGDRMERTGTKLLWGTANLFSHPRYMAGAATNPDAEVFAYAAGQVRNVLTVTHQLGGENYVLWGGREGYDTLLNTDMKREQAQLARFLTMVVEFKHKIGFTGTILIEPKPCEPTKHQYDRDAATVHAFLRRFGLEKEVKLNIEANHATLAGHDFEHEIAYAIANDLLGSVDINRGDGRLGWDTDQFPNNVPELALALVHIVRAGGFATGGMNFDAKIRRQSTEPDDLFHAHIGGMDVLARALLAAEAMIRDGMLQEFVDERYKGWDQGLGAEIMAGDWTLDALADHALDAGIAPKPRSGRQEYLENLVNRFV